MKKMIKERQSRKGDIQSDSKDAEPTLVLPQLAKAETKAYSPGVRLSLELQIIGTLLIRNEMRYFYSGMGIK